MFAFVLLKTQAIYLFVKEGGMAFYVVKQGFMIYKVTPFIYYVFGSSMKKIESIVYVN
jgi:hypothetical protein